MTAIRRKIVRDLTARPLRSLLLTIAIAFGLGAFAALLGTYDVLVRAVAEGFAASNPAAATLYVDDVDEDLTAAIAARPDVAAAEARRLVTGRVRVAPAEWRGLHLFVIPDFAAVRVATIAPATGAWPPGPGEVLIERDALGVARTAVGDAIAVRLGNGPERTLSVTGTVTDVGQAQARMEQLVYAYITPATLPLLGFEARLDQLKITVSENPTDRAHIARVVDDIAARLESEGRAVNGVELPAPGKHPHDELMRFLFFIMGVFGFVGLLLTAFVVTNLVSGLMAAETRSIGVMRTLGGTRARIASFYLCQAALIGLAALVVSIPLAMAARRILAAYLGGLLNFDVEGYAPRIWVHAVHVGAAVVVPLAAAAIPVLRGTRTTIREALSDHGMPRRAIGASRIDRALARVRFLPLPPAMAVRNSFRRRGRFVFTVLTLGFAGLLFITAPNLRTSLIESLDRSFDVRKYDVAVSLDAIVALNDVRIALAEVPGIRGFEGWINAPAVDPRATDPSPSSDSTSRRSPPPYRPTRGHRGPPRVSPEAAVARGDAAFAVAALPATTKLLDFDIQSGRSFKPDDVATLIVNARLAKSRGLSPGDEIRLTIGPFDRLWKIVGISREPFAPPAAYVPLAVFETEGRSGLTNSLRIDFEAVDPQSLNTAKEAVDQALDNHGIRAQPATGARDQRASIYEHFVMVYDYLIIVAAVLGLIGALSLATTMALNVSERRRESAVMLAVGASPATLAWLFIAEAIFIALTSSLFAVLLSWPVLYSFTKLPFITPTLKFEPIGPLLWLLASMIIATAAAFLPAWRASRLTIREALTSD